MKDLFNDPTITSPWKPIQIENGYIVGDLQYLSWREFAKKLFTMPTDLESESLRYLVDCYRSALDKHSRAESLKIFWDEVDILKEDEKISKEEFDVLKSAGRGNVKAAQVLCKGACVCVHLPFITHILRAVLIQHKYKFKGLMFVRDQWLGFLFPRPGLKKTFNPADIKTLIRICQKQEGWSKSKAMVEIAEVLEVSERHIKKLGK